MARLFDATAARLLEGEPLGWGYNSSFSHFWFHQVSEIFSTSFQSPTGGGVRWDNREDRIFGVLRQGICVR